MMVGFSRICDCGGDEGGVGGGQGFDREMKREEGEKGFVFGIRVIEEENRICVTPRFPKMEYGYVTMASRYSRRVKTLP